MLEAFTDMLPAKFRPYAKLVIGLIGVTLTVLAVVAADNEIVVVAISVATALGIYGVPNKDSDGDGIPDFIDADSFKELEDDAPVEAEVEPEVEEDVESEDMLS